MVLRLKQKLSIKMKKLAVMVFFEWRALNRISFAFYSWSYEKHLNQLLEPLSQSQYLWDVGYRRLAVKVGQILNWRWFCKTIFPLASIRFHITPIRDICCPNHQCKVTNRIPCSRCNKLIWSLNIVKKYIYITLIYDLSWVNGEGIQKLPQIITSSLAKDV